MNDTHDEEACLLSCCPGILFAPLGKLIFNKRCSLVPLIISAEGFGMNCWVSSQHLTSFSLEWWNSNRVLLSFLSSHFFFLRHVCIVNTHICLCKCSNKPLLTVCSRVMSPCAHEPSCHSQPPLACGSEPMEIFNSVCKPSTCFGIELIIHVILLKTTISKKMMW